MGGKTAAAKKQTKQNKTKQNKYSNIRNDCSPRCRLGLLHARCTAHRPAVEARCNVRVGGRWHEGEIGRVGPAAGRNHGLVPGVVVIVLRAVVVTC